MATHRMEINKNLCDPPNHSTKPPAHLLSAEPFARFFLAGTTY